MIEAQRGKNVSQAMALAASQRGINAGAAARGAQQQAGQAGLEATQQGAIMRAQEQAQAQQMLGGALSGAREQDIGLAQLGQQAGLANLQSEQGQRQLNDQMTQYYLGMGMSLEQARLQAQMEIERLRAEQQIAQNQAIVAQSEGSANRSSGVWGGLMTGAGLLGAAALMSDRNVKKNIKPEEGKKLNEFMDALESYEFDYKDESLGKGKQHGIMVQDLEKSEIGKGLVIETPIGKAINTTKAVGPIFSALNQINRRQKKLEAMMRKK